MDLTVRSFERQHVPACLALLNGGLAYPPEALADIKRAWMRLLRDDVLNGCVIEMRGARIGAVVGFGASVFVSDEWAAHARSGRDPYLSARTLRLELEGGSPILRPRAIARDNDAGGLNVLILHYGEARDLPRDARHALRYQMFQAFVESHRGYCIKEVLQEFWDELDPEFVVRGWGRVLADYACFYRERGEAVPPPGRGPLLIGITREGCLAVPGSMAAPLFVHAPPRLSFTRAEQRLLAQALLAKTDTELTRSLRLALPTIKSRWRGIYDRVDRMAPDLLPAASPVVTAAARGQEKRRLLLEYIRRHPEELRPSLARRRQPPATRGS
jgi:hypothetical protein